MNDDSKSNDDLKTGIALWMIYDSILREDDEDDREPTREPESSFESEQIGTMHSFEDANSSDDLKMYAQWKAPDGRADDGHGDWKPSHTSKGVDDPEWLARMAQRVGGSHPLRGIVSSSMQQAVFFTIISVLLAILINHWIPLIGLGVACFCLFMACKAEAAFERCSFCKMYNESTAKTCWNCSKERRR